MSSMALTVGMSAISAAGKIKAGRAEQKIYDKKASQALLKGDIEAAQYAQMGADVLTRLNENLAALIANSAVGGGSISALAKHSEAEASREYATAADNAILAKEDAKSQAEQYRMAGDAAMQSARIGAIGTLFGGFSKARQLSPGVIKPGVIS